MFAFDNNELLASWLVSNPDEYLSSMINIVDWNRVIRFPDNQGFSNWAKDNNFVFHGQRAGHPGYAGYSAHRAAADYILDNYQL